MRPKRWLRNVPSKPFILFVCKHNSGRSQMAEVYLRHFAGDDVEVASAGTIAADKPDPGVVAVMRKSAPFVTWLRPTRSGSQPS